MKYTVITGASSGIGYETALAFAQRGKNMILVARRKSKLEELKKEILKLNKDLKVIIYDVDLSDPKNVYKFYDDLKSYSLETLINNAGIGNFDFIPEQNLEKIENMININITALTILSTLFTQDYEFTEGTQLINISSSRGYHIVQKAVSYCASKFYVSAFTEGLAKELLNRNAKLKVKILAPSATETKFAKKALDTENIDYKKYVPKFNTSKEVASLLLKLYDDDKILGHIDGFSYKFELTDSKFKHIK